MGNYVIETYHSILKAQHACLCTEGKCITFLVFKDEMRIRVAGSEVDDFIIIYRCKYLRVRGIGLAGISGDDANWETGTRCR